MVAHAEWFEPNHRLYYWKLVGSQGRRFLTGRSPKEKLKLRSGSSWEAGR